MKLTIEEIPDPRKHHALCVVCGNPPRYLAVLPGDGPAKTKGAFTLCSQCANDEAVLDQLGAVAEEF
jgi:hypothetical protein